MTTREVSRFYEGAFSKDGKRYTMRFRADNIDLAFDHAAHCARCEGYQVLAVSFIGRTEPPAMGVFKLDPESRR